jgi:hypothetical protein
LHPSPAKTHRALWHAQSIPTRPVVDRSLIERMREAAKEAIERARPQIEAAVLAA